MRGEILSVEDCRILAVLEDGASFETWRIGDWLKGGGTSGTAKARRRLNKLREAGLVISKGTPANWQRTPAGTKALEQHLRKAMTARAVKLLLSGQGDRVLAESGGDFRLISTRTKTRLTQRLREELPRLVADTVTRILHEIEATSNGQ